MELQKNNGLDPKYVSIKNNHLKIAWKCKTCGNEWETVPYVRGVMKCGCPACAGQVLRKGESFGDLFPEIAQEWNWGNNELSPFEVFPKSNKSVWWTCKNCGHNFKQEISHRTGRNSGCPLCSHNALVPGVNDMATLFPKIALDWDEDKNQIKASEISGGTNKKYWWKCHVCGYKWQAIVATRTKRGERCPCCSQTIAIPGKNDIKTLAPKVAARWDYQKNDTIPEMFSLGSNKKAWWLCEKGHSYHRAIYSECGGALCPVCTNRTIVPGENDLATLEPNLLLEWDYEKNDISPTQVSSRGDRKVWWLCQNGHSWQASIGQRVRTHSGCPKCYHERRKKNA